MRLMIPEGGNGKGGVDEELEGWMLEGELEGWLGGWMGEYMQVGL